MTPTQLKMARAGLGASLRDIEAETGLRANTVSRVENGKHAALSTTLDRLREFYEIRGVRFVRDGKAEGVFISPASQPDLFEKEK